jgi:hypothetical protein
MAAAVRLETYLPIPLLVGVVQLLQLLLTLGLMGAEAEEGEA